MFFIYSECDNISINGVVPDQSLSVVFAGRGKVKVYAGNIKKIDPETKPAD